MSTNPGYYAVNDPLMGPVLMFAHHSGIADIEGRYATVAEATTEARRRNLAAGLCPSTMPGQHSGVVRPEWTGPLGFRVR